MVTLSTLIGKSIEIVVHVRNSGYNEAELADAGIELLCHQEQSIQCAIIDKTTVWYGNINFFGFNSDDSNMMRIENSKVAEEMIDALYCKD